MLVIDFLNFFNLLIIGGDFWVLKLYVFCFVGVVLGLRKKWVFYFMCFINSLVFLISFFKYDDFDVVGIFFVEYLKDIWFILIYKF